MAHFQNEQPVPLLPRAYSDGLDKLTSIIWSCLGPPLLGEATKGHSIPLHKRGIVNIVP